MGLHRTGGHPQAANSDQNRETTVTIGAFVVSLCTPPVSSSVSSVVQAAAEDEEANAGEGEDDDDEPGDEELREVRKRLRYHS